MERETKIGIAMAINGLGMLLATASLMISTESDPFRLMSILVVAATGMMIGYLLGVL